MLVKARKASIEDRISKRLKSCLGKSTFRPRLFIRILFPVLLFPHRTRASLTIGRHTFQPISPYLPRLLPIKKPRQLVPTLRHFLVIRGLATSLMTPWFPRSFRFCNFTFPHSFIFSHDPLVAPSLFPHDVTFLTNLSHDASYWTHPLIHCLAPFFRQTWSVRTTFTIFKLREIKP